jgi:hypothetical protein
MCVCVCECVCVLQFWKPGGCKLTCVWVRVCVSSLPRCVAPAGPCPYLCPLVLRHLGPGAARHDATPHLRHLHNNNNNNNSMSNRRRGGPDDIPPHPVA